MRIHSTETVAHLLCRPGLSALCCSLCFSLDSDLICSSVRWRRLNLDFGFALVCRGMGNYAHPKVLPMIVATGNDLGLFSADSNETTFLGACELLFTSSCVYVS
eukprot:COSAG02_NODE_998_length_15331_cov_38.406119_11_plen_104_part_00